ncbi:DUF4087 domain-containing protein [Agrobacterium sp. a22-2]|nr:DUF4087 domain-containing protein [Agrobacterium sp. a22-2]
MLSRSLAVTMALSVSLFAGSVLAKETRCGWLQNPTPGNLWLDDSQGTWVLSTQGSDEEALGMENIGDFSTRDYVRTNGYYGYACACMDVETDAAAERITAVYSFRQLPLAKCTKDKALPAPQ